jgi:hypothetical protein
MASRRGEPPWVVIAIQREIIRTDYRSEKSAGGAACRPMPVPRRSGKKSSKKSGKNGRPLAR